MSESKIQFFKTPPNDSYRDDTQREEIQRLEPSTCTEAETFVLQVLDDSMEPEFVQSCMIVIDPTGLATDGSYVLARRTTDETDVSVEDFHFRQLRRSGDGGWQLCSLNDAYPSEPTASDFSEIVGVIVQRAGTRRRYHKRYD